MIVIFLFIFLNLLQACQAFPGIFHLWQKVMNDMVLFALKILYKYWWAITLNPNIMYIPFVPPK